MSETEHKAIVDIYGDGPIEHKKSCKCADCKSELTAQRIADLEQQLSEVTAERDRLRTVYFNELARCERAVESRAN